MSKVGAAPHLPTGILSPYSDGERGAFVATFANRQRCKKGAGVAASPFLPVTIRGVEEWSAKRTKSQLLGFSNDERPQGNEGRRKRSERQGIQTTTGPAPYCRLYSRTGDLVPSV